MTSKQEYLKRYLSADTASTKKKNRHAMQKSRVKILDDDIDVKALIPSNVNNSLDDDICDDKPEVAEFVDERPDDVRELERFRQSKQWKIVGQFTESPGDTNLQLDTLSPSLRKNERHDSDSDLSPDRNGSWRTGLATDKNREHSSYTSDQKREGSGSSPSHHSNKQSRDKVPRCDSGSESRQADSSVRRRRRRDDSCSDSDLSPARQGGSKQVVGQSRSVRVRHDSDSDLSPPQQTGDRKTDRHDSDSDLSPVSHAAEKHAVNRNQSNKVRHDSDSDLSPARRDGGGEVVGRKRTDRVGRHDSDSDLSPVRQGATKQTVSRSRTDEVRHDSDSDLSPARRGRDGKGVDHTRIDRVGRHDSDSDLSPLRKDSRAIHHHNSDSDLSPVRHADQVSKARHDSKKSSSHHSSRKKDSRQSNRSRRARHENGAGSDQSPARRKITHDGDLSPPRKKRSPCVIAGNSSNRDLSPVRKASKTLAGAKAGLQSAADMKKESVELKRREEEAFVKIAEDMSGRNAQAILRDKSTGRKRNLVEEQEAKAKEDALKAATASKYEDWNKGLQQKAIQSEMLAEALVEVNKPLARYVDDADLDARLREREHEDDPMLAYIKKKKVPTATLR